MGSYQTSIYEGYERMIDYEKEMNDVWKNIRWLWFLVGGILTFYLLSEILASEVHITYSGDNFLKVEENWTGEIAKVERCTFERTRVELGLRPYFTCNEISTYEEILNNQN